MRIPAGLLCLSALLAPAAVPAADAPAWKWTPEAIVDAVAVGNAVMAPDG